MPRYPKDLVEFVANKTNRYILRILHNNEGLIAAEIGRNLEKTAKIRFKSTSTLTEALQRLVNFRLIEKKDKKYHLSDQQRFIVRFLNMLVEEKLDTGKKIKSK